jgi:hypothetical protein
MSHLKLIAAFELGLISTAAAADGCCGVAKRAELFLAFHLAAFEMQIAVKWLFIHTLCGCECAQSTKVVLE